MNRWSFHTHEYTGESVRTFTVYWWDSNAEPRVSTRFTEEGERHTLTIEIDPAFIDNLKIDTTKGHELYEFNIPNEEEDE